jgi:dephospho-CoA kinase
MRKIGLTGGIGSGKSTVAKMLSQRGLALIDADAMSRELTAPGGLAMPAIVEALGPELKRHERLDAQGCQSEGCAGKNRASLGG